MRSIPLVAALALILTACQSTPAPTFPNVQGTWTDPNAQTYLCGTVQTIEYELTLEQDGTNLTGSLTLTTDSGSGSNPFEGKINPAGNITGNAEYALNDTYIITDLTLIDGTLSGTFTSSGYSTCPGYMERFITHANLSR